MDDRDDEAVATVLAQIWGIPAEAVPFVVWDAGMKRAAAKAMARYRRAPKRRGRKQVWTPLMLRALSRKFERRTAGCGLSRNAMIPHFLEEGAAPARANRSLWNEALAALDERTLSNYLGRGDALRGQRPLLMSNPQFRRWANELRRHSAFGSKRLFWREVRAALNSGKLGDYTALADQAEIARIMDERALLGEAHGSFIIFDK